MMEREAVRAAASRANPATHRRGAHKLLRARSAAVASEASLAKPRWLRIRPVSNPPSGSRVARMRRLLRQDRLHTVCEEARCPNLNECFSRGVATFMILGDRCTRRCAFCDVAHGRPLPPDPREAERLARVVRRLGLAYVVVTSVDRDDLDDGGAAHFAACIRELRAATTARVEILVPDFRRRMERALIALARAPCDVFAHNVETAPRLYREVRAGADYSGSLRLLLEHKRRFPDIPTKSSLMLGLGETTEEIEEVMRDLRRHRVDLLTIGQYLRPAPGYWPVRRYAGPAEFDRLADAGRALGFRHVASGPLVRSSYRADERADERADALAAR